VPTTITFVLTGGAASVASWLWPDLGKYALIFFGAVVGSLLAMSKRPTPTRWDGIKFIAAGVALVMVFNGLAVWALEKYTPIPGSVAMMPVAFVIAVKREALLGLIDKGVEGLGVLLVRVAKRKSGK
jgi:hypothetical protein